MAVGAWQRPPTVTGKWQWDEICGLYPQPRLGFSTTTSSLAACCGCVPCLWPYFRCVLAVLRVFASLLWWFVLQVALAPEPLAAHPTGVTAGSYLSLLYGWGHFTPVTHIETFRPFFWGAQKSHGHPALPVGFPAPPSVAFDEGPRLHCWDGIGPRKTVAPAPLGLFSQWLKQYKECHNKWKWWRFWV